MIILLTILCTVIVVLLHMKVASKNAKTLNRICITSANAILSLIFLVLFSVFYTIRNGANDFIDTQITTLEQKVNEIYPNAMNEQMSTVEIKELLASTLTKNTSQSAEAAAENIAKGLVSDYTSSALEIINSLERTSGKISAKEALVSLKEQLLEKTMPYFTFLTVALFIAYFIGLIIIAAVSIILAKQTVKDDGIIYGEDADATKIGVRSDI
ncbi:MAG: hypothetical protein MJY87_07185 [Fibrobacter sp.]|nr:hypothetical protein [Fibrobacter sp.]